MCLSLYSYTTHHPSHIKNKGGLEGFLTIVYGLNTHGERLQLWKEPQDLQITDSPWLLTGDFNIAHFSDEKVGDRTLTYQQLSAFNDFIANCALSDLRSVGESMDLKHLKFGWQ